MDMSKYTIMCTTPQLNSSLTTVQLYYILYWYYSVCMYVCMYCTLFCCMCIHYLLQLTLLLLLSANQSPCTNANDAW